MDDLIRIFEDVRDIRYHIPLTPYQKDNTCSGKSEMLAAKFKILGYKARYRVCMFLWKDLDLPKNVEKFPHDERCTHVYVEIYLKNKWRTVDPTWDSGLGSIFHINTWDGKGDTGIAVKPIRTFSPKKSTELLDSQKSKEFIEKDLKENGAFYKAFNLWISKSRNNRTS